MATDPDATAQYMTGQMRPDHPALLAAFAADSEAAVAALRPAVDVPYGRHPRETFDFFAAPGTWRGTAAYFHAGYWQSRDKALFRFLAPILAAHGIDLALVNYPLCPDVTLAELVESTRASIPAVLAHAAGLGRGGRSLVASGHSAGGHIAAELALTDWAAWGIADSPIAGVAGLSGVYDLAPLLGTPLNDKLRLGPADARALSPLHRLPNGLPPALFAVGGTETPAFVAQNAAMGRAWAAAGNPAECLVVDGADHFSLLSALRSPGPLLTAILTLVQDAAAKQAP